MSTNYKQIDPFIATLPIFHIYDSVRVPYKPTRVVIGVYSFPSDFVQVINHTEDLIHYDFAVVAPLPRVVERANLRGRVFAVVVLENHVIRAFGVERRIEIDQIHEFIGEILPIRAGFRGCRRRRGCSWGLS